MQHTGTVPLCSLCVLENNKMKKRYVLYTCICILLLSMFIVSCTNKDDLSDKSMDNKNSTSQIKASETAISTDNSISTPSETQTTPEELPLMPAATASDTVTIDNLITTDEKIIKVSDDTISKLSQITFINISGKMTFYLGMPAKDAVLEYFSINEEYQKIAQEKIKFFENAQPEDEPYLVTDDGTMEILFDNGKISRIAYFCRGFQDSKSNFAFEILNEITNRSSINDIIKIMGNPQKIEKSYKIHKSHSQNSEYGLGYKIFKDETTSLNLLFDFSEDRIIDFIMSYTHE